MEVVDLNFPTLNDTIHQLKLPPSIVNKIHPRRFIDVNEFRDGMPKRMEDSYMKAIPEELINYMLPLEIIGVEARKVAAVFWLWLCFVDGMFSGLVGD